MTKTRKDIRRKRPAGESQRQFSGNSPAPTPQILKAWIAENARRFPDKVFVHSIDQNRKITYRQLETATDQIADFLKDRAIGTNDRVALMAHNSIEHLTAYIGVMAYGATVCTIHVEMNAAYFEDILSGLAPRLVFHEDGLDVQHLAGQVDAEWHALGDWRPEDESELFAGARTAAHSDSGQPTARRDDDACICYTSGTSNRPKGVILSFAELLDNIEPIADAFGITAQDRILDFRSYNWASAQILSGLAPLARGATVIMARKFSQSRFFDWVREYQATIATGNPTTISMLMNRTATVAPEDVASLRFVTSSSAPLPMAVAERFEAQFGIPIAQGYGTSETGWIAGSNEATRRPGSVGKPLPYHALTIVDEAGHTLPPGEIGLIELGNDPDRAYRYVNKDGSVRINARGRIRTGDLGYLDDDGYLYLTGRKKDLIIRGGVNIAPAEIDSVLMHCTCVLEAATIGVPDDIYGEEVVSYVVVKPGSQADEAALIAHCREHLPAFKTPKRIRFRDHLPKTDRGKIDRRALMEAWASDEPAK